MPEVEMSGSAPRGARGADAAVLVTEWPEFAELDWPAGREWSGRCSSTAATSSTRRHCAAAGFAYEGSAAWSGPPPPTAVAGLGGMQALILVGGKGTRLRPLTNDIPKPAVTLVDRPFLAYMIDGWPATAWRR